MCSKNVKFVAISIRSVLSSSQYTKTLPQSPLGELTTLPRLSLVSQGEEIPSPNPSPLDTFGFSILATTTILRPLETKFLAAPMNVLQFVDTECVN